MREKANAIRKREQKEDQSEICLRKLWARTLLMEAIKGGVSHDDQN